MIALLISLCIVVPFAALFFFMGRAWERIDQDLRTVSASYLRHPSHHHRRSSVRVRRQTHLRLLATPFDQDAS